MLSCPPDDDDDDDDDVIVVNDVTDLSTRLTNQMNVS